MPFDPRIHHRRSVRLGSWDYTWAWWYYVTVCTRNRECVFGEIHKGKVILNDIGKIVQEEWLRAPIVRPGVELDGYVIMPNHIHGIIILPSPKAQNPVGATRRVAPTKTLPSGSLGAIIGQFKSIVTKRVRGLGLSVSGPLWQRNFYDHIIRNDADLHRVRTYMANNPGQWDLDEENPAYRP